MLLLKNAANRQIFKLFRLHLRFSSTIGTLPKKDKIDLKNQGGNLGQPTPWTHPHLLKEGEIVPYIKPEEFKERRCRLMQGILKHTKNIQPIIKNHIVVIPSATKKYMSDKIPYVFRQNTEFFYLTGCLEPDSILVMTINEKGDSKSTLFMRPKDKHAELWDGARTGVENSVEFFGVDEAYPVGQFSQEINRKTEQKNYTDIWYEQESSEQHFLNEILKSTEPKIPIKSPAMFLQGMRLIKSPAEIELMKETCQIASEAVNETMAESKPGISEHQIFAMVDYKCRMKHASHLAYPPVVAAGNNATTIHYINNTQLAKNGDMVLLDAGCEYGGYTSDITRTWPINGQFTRAQKILYDIILALQKDIMGVVLKENGDTLNKLFEYMCLKLGKYLREASILRGNISSDHELAKAAYQYCPHHVSHYLGMDVHDTPLMSRNLKLVPGMVFTIEPGIYIAKDRLDVPKEFRGLGIRIEDDVYVSEPECIVNLTENCVKEYSRLQRLLKAKTR